MLEVAVAAALAALIAGVVTGAMVPFATKIAFAVSAVDYPDGRKIQQRAVPRLGGVAIGIGLAFAAGTVTLRSARS
jgi:UDP-GlcNAc:undecaprenyl-phosphate GlcNAc-1-phosphate transferase